MSRFQPVHLPEDRQLNGKASQTLLKHFNSCARSGYFYALYKGEASTPEMERGKALHAVAERSIRAMVEQGEPMIPPEVVKAIANEVLAEFGVPMEETDYLREMAARLGSEFTITPGSVVACETFFALDVGGYQVRCRIDFAELREEGAVVYVADWKSSRAAPSFEDVSRKRPDGSFMAKSFQLVMYALVLAFGVPVRVETCAVCGGEGMVSTGNLALACAACGGDVPSATPGMGRVEIPEPFPVAARAQRFDLEFLFPGIEDREGKMLRRPVSLTRLELEEYRASLEGLLTRLAHSEESGDWPAVASDAACSECPAASLCPIPAELRNHAGTINTLEEASEAAEVLYREKKELTARQTELRNFAKSREVAVPFGNDMVWDFSYSEAEEIKDKDAMWSALERSVSYGEPFDRGQHVKRKQRTDFRARALTADELLEKAIESEGSNGSNG